MTNELDGHVYLALMVHLLSSFLLETTVDPGFTRGHGERVYREPITGVWAELPGGLRGRASGRGSSEKVERWALVEGKKSGEGLTEGFRGPGCCPGIGKFFENIGANLCNLVHFGGIKSKWDVKSGTEFTV